MSEKIMLVDGHSIINRAFYALPALKNKNGDYTNGVYGFLNIIIKFFNEENPDYLAVAFDLSAPTFRHDKFVEYKGTRKSMPEELRPQIPMLKDLLRKMNIPIYEIEGFEADDVLGSLAKKGEAEGLDVVLVSGDRDLLQIASDKIQIKIPKTKAGKTEVESYYADDLINIYGVTPHEFIDVKALMGDASDNIPGVPGIGEKTALKIIQEYKSLENAISNAENLKPKKASENIIAYSEQAYLSRYLATIVTDVPVDVPGEKVSYESIFNETAIKEFENLNFNTLVKKYDTNKNTQSTLSDKNYKLIKTAAEASFFMEEIDKNSLCAVDFIVIDGVCYGFSFYSENKGRFVEFSENLTLTEFLGIAKSFFEGKNEKITLDSKNMMVLLYKNNISIDNIVFDTILAGYILNSSAAAYNDDNIALRYLEENYPSLEDIAGKGKSRIKFNELDENTKLLYACRRTDIIFRAYPVMKKMIHENEQDMLYYEIEMPTAKVLAAMELEGIKVNREALTAFDKVLSLNIESLAKEIHELAEEDFNINSPQQLGIILFEKLGLKGGKKTKTGYSTAADVLEKLRYSHPVVEKVLLYRTLTKLKSTYCDGLLNVMDKETDKIYSTFNQTVASTGRLSSTEPNLQNIPVRMELGRELRKVFIPSETDCIFVDADYSQIELRILAHISGDETMIKAYKSGEDIHRITASQVLHKSPEDVTSFERNSAKAINFGIVYGISAFSLSEDLGITKKEAENYISAYFEKYPKIKQYMDNAIAEAKELGYAKTMFNRRREILELASSNFNLRSFGERVAMNMPIQGSAADIMKIAMIKVYERLKKENLKSKIVLQVHDELLIETKIEEEEIVKRLVKEEMENAAVLLVPLEADVASGKTWFDTK